MGRKSLLVFAIILILWQLTSYLNIWNDYVLPAPTRVLETYIIMIKDGSLLVHILVSMKRIIIGFFISLSIGIPLGIYFGIHNDKYEYFKTLFNFLRNTPPLALIPMLILWFGIGEVSKIIIIVLASFFPIFNSTLKGIKGCDKKLIEVGSTFQFTKVEIITNIIIPSAILDIVLGLKLALGYSFRAIIGAELIAASSGLGYLISDGKEMSRTDIVIVGIITIGILGVVTDTILSKYVKFAGRGRVLESND